MTVASHDRWKVQKSLNTKTTQSLNLNSSERASYEASTQGVVSPALLTLLRTKAGLENATYGSRDSLKVVVVWGLLILVGVGGTTRKAHGEHK